MKRLQVVLSSTTAMGHPHKLHPLFISSKRVFLIIIIELNWNKSIQCIRFAYFSCWNFNPHKGDFLNLK
jgi:hypothetical protein